MNKIAYIATAVLVLIMGRNEAFAILYFFMTDGKAFGSRNTLDYESDAESKHEYEAPKSTETPILKDYLNAEPLVKELLNDISHDDSTTKYYDPVPEEHKPAQEQKPTAKPRAKPAPEQKPFAEPVIWFTPAMKPGAGYRSTLVQVAGYKATATRVPKYKAAAKPVPKCKPKPQPVRKYAPKPQPIIWYQPRIIKSVPEDERTTKPRRHSRNTQWKTKNSHQHGKDSETTHRREWREHRPNHVVDHPIDGISRASASVTRLLRISKDLVLCVPGARPEVQC